MNIPSPLQVFGPTGLSLCTGWQVDEGWHPPSAALRKGTGH